MTTWANESQAEGRVGPPQDASTLATVTEAQALASTGALVDSTVTLVVSVGTDSIYSWIWRDGRLHEYWKSLGSHLGSRRIVDRISGSGEVKSADDVGGSS